MPSHSENAGDYDRLRRLSPSALAAEFDTYASQFLAGIRLAFDSDRARLQLVRRNLPETGDVACPAYRRSSSAERRPKGPAPWSGSSIRDLATASSASGKPGPGTFFIRATFRAGSAANP